MSPEYFLEERKMAIEKALDVSEVFPLKNQGQVLVDELECSLQSDVSEESLPLLLHQVKHCF